MYKIQTLIVISLFSCLSLGICPPDDGSPNYDYINPEVDTQLGADQVFVIKEKGLIMSNSFPSFCSDIDELAKSENLDPNQMFMIIGEFMVAEDEDSSYYEGYFKVALINKDGVIDTVNTGWIPMMDFQEMNTNGKVEKTKGELTFKTSSNP